MFGSRVARTIAATLLSVAGATGGLLGAAAAGAATPVYYVAMGDSLGAGVGANPGSNSYVNLVYAHEAARIPGLQLRNFSCSGATTTSVIHGGNCGSPTTQLATAAAFLKAHPGQVAFLTVDIGANDVDGCASGGTINNTCLANGLAAVNTNLPLILSGLKTAYPGIRIFGMNYYDPFLASWLTGAAGQALAQQSVPQADSFNSILANRYTAAGFPTADVATAFQTDDFSLTGTYNTQTEPQNVADICNWTHMCEAGDIHANNIGHAVLAQSFEPLIDAPAAPDAPISVTAAPGSTTATVRWARPAIQTSAVTGYVVTPYLGTVAQTARTFNTPALAATVTGLTNAKSYTFKVAARSVVGTGRFSAASKPVVIGAPAAPPKPTVTKVAAGSLRVAFTRPANNGAAITNYATTCMSSNAGVAGSKTTLTIPVVVTGLTAGKRYTCAVRAFNSRGSGPSSPASAAVVA